MREIKTIDVERYSEPDENRRVKFLGMITAQETFDALKAHLEKVGLLPDEYFLPGDFEAGQELPRFNTAICHTNWGGSEGIYIDIALRYMENNQLKFFDFATGKTLGASGDDFLRMSRIAAECSIMLNGRGSRVKVNEEQNIEQDKNSDFTKNELVDMLENLVHSPHLPDRKAVAEQGYGLDKLIYDREFSVRRICAEKGVGQDILVNDPESTVREALARNGYCLDVLIKDPIAHVRAEVAYQGYGLDELVEDPDLLVRAAVASQGRAKDLAVLVNDTEWFVRTKVAEQGFGLDKLFMDHDFDVRNAVKKFLEKQDITLATWIKQNPDKCVMAENKKGGLDAIIARAVAQNKELAFDQHDTKTQEHREER